MGAVQVEAPSHNHRIFARLAQAASRVDRYERLVLSFRLSPGMALGALRALCFIVGWIKIYLRIQIPAVFLIHSYTREGFAI